MSLSIGIVGLPNVGKSTLFNALTKKSVPADNYPFCTIDPSVGIVPVPDERLKKLSDLSHSQKTIPAVVEFVDIAGLVKGAAEGEGLGNQFLSHIRETDAVAEIIRIFEDENIVHVSGRIDPLDDIETINAELILADLGTVSKRKDSVEKDAKRGEKTAVQLFNLLEKIENMLKEGKTLNLNKWTFEEFELLKSLHLLTMKPFIYVLNKKEGAFNLDEMKDERWGKLNNFFEKTKNHFVVIDAKTEDQIKDFSSEEKEELMGNLAANAGCGVDALIKESYRMLDLITFFTTGEDETRAWTIKRGSTAPIAGAAIHGDFRDKFIRAEVVYYGDLIDSLSYTGARAKGLVRTEGKDYIVKDGDIIEFRI